MSAPNSSSEARNPDEAAEVQVQFTVKSPHGEVEVSATVPTGHMTLTQLLPVLQQITSSVASAAEMRVHEEGKSISCKAGCGACCRQLVPLSLFEAEAMADWVRQLPEDQQGILHARFQYALQQLQAKGFLEKMDPAKISNMTEQENQAFLLEYLALGVACPFLQNESCSIHPIRPLICREYLVTSPPEFCANPTAETLNVVKLPLKMSTGLVKAARRLPGESNGRIPLVFLMAWMKRETHPGNSFYGSGAELLARLLQECSEAEEAKG